MPHRQVTEAEIIELLMLPQLQCTQASRFIIQLFSVSVWDPPDNVYVSLNGKIFLMI